MPVCWRCLRWGWRDNRQRRRRCRSNHSRTAVWRENDNDVDIHREKKTIVTKPEQLSGGYKLPKGSCLYINTKKGRTASFTVSASWGLSQSRQPWGLLGKPALPVIACSRLVLLITIRHASPRITPSNIIVLTTTSTESRSELFIRTCMSRYLKLHILSASHKFAYRRESS